jgi:hypothetical protein
VQLVRTRARLQGGGRVKAGFGQHPPQAQDDAAQHLFPRRGQLLAPDDFGKLVFADRSVPLGHEVRERDLAGPADAPRTDGRRVDLDSHPSGHRYP